MSAPKDLSVCLLILFEDKMHMKLGESDILIHTRLRKHIMEASKQAVTDDKQRTEGVGKTK